MMADGRCACKCPGGHDCVYRGDVRHELHICNVRACECHSQARYEGRLVPAVEIDTLGMHWRVNRQRVTAIAQEASK